MGREQHADGIRRDALVEETRDRVAHPVDERLDEAGVVEELAHLVDRRPSPARPVSASTRAKSSRYWRQLENDEYALVASAEQRRVAGCRASRTASSRYGAQLRLPQYTGRSMPRRASSASSAAFSARFWALIGLTPPKWR